MIIVSDLVYPFYRAVAVGTLNSILKQAGLK
jgi:predicted RNA binding protein YcfA (HicA-like mRNA interferase family)